MFRGPVVLLLGAAILMACGRPVAEPLRQHPAPVLSLEVALPGEPGEPVLREAYLSAFRAEFGSGLATGPAASAPDAIQLHVLVGSRTYQNPKLDQGTRALDQAMAVASGSPTRMAYAALGPRSNYENAIQLLGYEPALIRGQLVVMKAGKDSFQATLKFDPMRIIHRMRPLGAEARAHGGIEAEEGRAVAMESLDLLQQQFGWRPPRP